MTTIRPENNKPIIYLTFANENTQYLEFLKVEQERLKDIFHPLEKEVIAKIEKKTEIDTLFEGFRKFGKRIFLFHYAGHASHGHLLLEDALAKAESLVDMIKAEGAEKLQLVVLNGCATEFLVDKFLSIGTRAVLATSVSIEDHRALLFAEAFYRSLAHNNTLKGAFESAKARLNTVANHESTMVNIIYRNEGFAEENEGKAFPWGLYLREGDDDILQWKLADAIDNHLMGLPPLPKTIGLPKVPFKSLAFYTRDDARVFFGRDKQIRELYNKVTFFEGPNITLLYGQSGVGKSSLLFAGLFPRLETEWGQPQYIREDHQRGLTLLQEWLIDTIKEKAIFIFDQLEELITLHPTQAVTIMEVFLKRLDHLLAQQPARQCKIILGFRKEYFAEIEKILNRLGTGYQKFFIESINRKDIIKIVKGLTVSAEIRNQYCLSIQPPSQGELPLADIIANDILQDRQSNIAPALQILLEKMWKKALRENGSKPIFDLASYNEIKQDGLLLKNHIEKIIDQVKKDKVPERSLWAESGLILDFLHYFTTDEGTVNQHTRMDLAQRYKHILNWPNLLKYSRDSYLITEYSRDQTSSERFRLAHDALGPIIRRLFDTSELSGQQAWRVINAKGDYVLADCDNRRFSESDIEVIEKGRNGMPILHDKLKRKIQADQKYYLQQRKDRFDLAFNTAVLNVEYPQFKQAVRRLEIAQQERLFPEKILQKAKELIYPLAFLKTETRLKDILRLIVNLSNDICISSHWKSLRNKITKRDFPSENLFQEIEQWFRKKEPDLYGRMQERFIPKLVPIPGNVLGNRVPKEKLIFEMGAKGDELVFQREGPAHRVSIDPYRLADSPVTFWQYGLYCLATERPLPRDSGFRRDRHPVVNVNWCECIAYTNWLSQQFEEFSEVYLLDSLPSNPKNWDQQNINWEEITSWKSNGFRLPTEAEWEFAATARIEDAPSGVSQIKKWRFGNGKDIADPDEMNFDASSANNSYTFDRGWIKKIQEDGFKASITPVKAFASKNNNPFGLYDLSGNVYEWCWDWYSGDLSDQTDKYYTECRESGISLNPRGAKTGRFRVIRGGSWNHLALETRSVYRHRVSPILQFNSLGFRVAQRGLHSIYH